MAKKMSVTEIETLTDYVAGILYNEQRELSLQKLNNCTQKQYDARKAELQKVRDAYNKAKEELDNAITKNSENPLYLNGKTLAPSNLYYENTIAERTLSDEKVFGTYDYKGDLAREVKTKIILRNLSSEADVESIISELRASLIKK